GEGVSIRGWAVEKSTLTNDFRRIWRRLGEPFRARPYKRCQSWAVEWTRLLRGERKGAETLSLGLARGRVSAPGFVHGGDTAGFAGRQAKDASAGLEGARVRGGLPFRHGEHREKARRHGE